MRLVTVAAADGNPAGGVLTASGSIAPLALWGCPTVEALVQAGPATWAAVEQEAASATPAWPAGQPLRAPVARPPRNLLCAGLNYLPHFTEGDRGGTQMPPYPVIFTKPWTTIIGPADDLVVDPAVTREADWEAELAIVIGAGGADIGLAEAMDHVFGYCLANDVSARDLQRANGTGSQWHKGKSLDGFCPLGPHLVTPASMPDFGELRVQLTVNGTLKQDFRPADMYWPIPALIAYLSAGMALLPGDVILTGTGSGVGLWRDPPEFLREGDVIQISCPGLGELRNRVVGRGERSGAEAEADLLFIGVLPERKSMGTEFINPPTAFNSLPRGYSHVVKVTNPRAFYFVAGAAAVDTDLQLQHPGDVAGQTRLIFQNIARDLEASGASLADIVDMTVYLADVSDQWRVRGVRNEFFPADRLPSSTMIGVSGFCIEGMLIEIDVIAATS